MALTCGTIPRHASGAVLPHLPVAKGRALLTLMAPHAKLFPVLFSFVVKELVRERTAKTAPAGLLLLLELLVEHEVASGQVRAGEAWGVVREGPMPAVAQNVVVESLRSVVEAYAKSFPQDEVVLPVLWAYERVAPRLPAAFLKGARAHTRTMPPV